MNITETDTRTKICIGCGAEKTLTEFKKRVGRKDGRGGRCKACCNAAKKAYARTARGRAACLAASRKYENSEKGKASRKEYIQKGRGREVYLQKARTYYKKNPDKYQIYAAVKEAKKTGVLIPQPCEVCGTNDNIDAHHDDYSKPLEVRWLCKKHHSALHMERRDND